MSYIPYRNELSFLEGVDFSTWYFPMSAQDATLLWARPPESHILWKKDATGAPTPDQPDTAFLPPENLQPAIVLVPALLVDAQGFRLGNGGGYYDRLLSRISSTCLSIALCHSDFLVEKVPNESWDMPVDLMVSERGFYIPMLSSEKQLQDCRWCQHADPNWYQDISLSFLQKAQKKLEENGSLS